MCGIFLCNPMSLSSMMISIYSGQRSSLSTVSGDGDHRRPRTSWKHDALAYWRPPQKSWYSHHPCTAPPPTGLARLFHKISIVLHGRVLEDAISRLPGPILLCVQFDHIISLVEWDWWNHFLFDVHSTAGRPRTYGWTVETHTTASASLATATSRRRPTAHLRVCRARQLFRTNIAYAPSSPKHLYLSTLLGSLSIAAVGSCDWSLDGLLG
jgi:hypothetical protein